MHNLKKNVLIYVLRLISYDGSISRGNKGTNGHMELVRATYPQRADNGLSNPLPSLAPMLTNAIAECP